MGEIRKGDIIMKITLKAMQPDMKQVLVDNEPFAVAIKIDGVVILDHVGSDDITLDNLTTPEGKVITHWSQVADWVIDYLNN